MKGGFTLSLLLAINAASAAPALSQLTPSQTDALSKLQASQNSVACSATDTSSCTQAAAKLMPLILGDSPMIENLRKLTDGIGGRVTGSPEMMKAVQWGVAGFRAAGVDVHAEKYALPVTWKEGATRLMVTAPSSASFTLRAVSEAWGPATPPEGIESDVIDVGDGSDAEFSRAGSIKGAILLIHSDIGSSWADLFNEYLRPPAIIAHAIRDGAAAILWMGARERLLLYRHPNSLTGEIDKIPQVVIAREHALELARLVAANQSTRGTVRVRLVMPNEIGGPAEQENVVGEIRGYQKPEEVVILGAHLDSWELGAGALDNGCNAALVVEAARAIKALGVLPKRTIRFILFSGEEQGTIGSFAYVKSHAAELDKLRAVIIFDSGTGRTTGYSLGGRTDTETGLRQILQPLDSWSVNQHTADASFGTDNFDFLLEGVPTFVANQEIGSYLANYHAASDTFDKVDQRELKMNTVIAALTAWGVADRAEPIGKRLSRAELNELVKRTGLDEQLKALGYWEQWQNGTRGRRP